MLDSYVVFTFLFYKNVNENAQKFYIQLAELLTKSCRKFIVFCFQNKLQYLNNLDKIYKVYITGRLKNGF